MKPIIIGLLRGRKGGSDGANAYLVKCKIAALRHEREVGANKLGEDQSVAAKGLSDGPPVVDVAQTSSRAKVLIGLAVGICLALAFYVETVWPHRGTVVAAKSLQNDAKTSRRVVAPLEPTDEFVGTLANIEEVDLDAGSEYLHETGEPPRDLAATGLPTLTARAGQEAPEAYSIPIVDTYPDAPEVSVRVDGESPLVPPVLIRLQEARATAVETAIELLVAKPAPPPESAASLLRQGQRLLENGDINAARDLFEDLADAGIVDGAIALGSTYDPKSLASSGMTNVTPDPNKALLWYRRAHLLAESDAKRERRSDHRD